MNTRQTASVLTKDDARAIYHVKRSGKCRHDAALLGAHYGISAKAVRDVWSHRTWSEATMCLWTLQDVTKYVHMQLCSDCRDAEVSFDNGTGACTNCKRFMTTITTLMTDAGQTNNGQSESQSVALAGNPDAPSASGDGTARDSLRSSDCHPIWRRQNSLHDGLLDEALDSV